ncbi:MAG: hypothetical protein AMXMBFR61_09560 [Fimbriimonadales bacterium]
MEMLLRSVGKPVPNHAREYAGRKLRKIEKFFHKVGAIEFVYDELRGQHSVEFTVDADGYYVRGSDTDTDLHAAIDRAVDKLETQLKRFRGRIIRYHRSKGNKQMPEGFAEFAPSAEQAMEEDPIPRIAERRSLNQKPMTPEEAAFQLDLLGQDFLFFRDATTSSASLIYRRGDGNLVLIES